ncbi:hypothetical protein J4Q44_G00114170 [Coregonus suidteri]|uniref:Uncharacterized protein n=1 Tax=Coregonus suidteri TaxID=861788 RepID=A0AAN8QZI0_9TELE
MTTYGWKLDVTLDLCWECVACRCLQSEAWCLELSLALSPSLLVAPYTGLRLYPVSCRMDGVDLKGLVCRQRSLFCDSVLFFSIYKRTPPILHTDSEPSIHTNCF